MTSTGMYLVGVCIGFVAGICFIKLGKNKVVDKINGFFDKIGK